jgi:hypothetical protein
MPEDLLTMSAKEVDRAGLIRRVLEVRSAGLRPKRENHRRAARQKTSAWSARPGQG